MARGPLTQGFEVTLSELEAYQAPTQVVRTLIQKAEFVNTGVAPVTINVWITPDSGTSSADRYKVIDDKQIGVGQTYVAIELIAEYVETGGKVLVQADVLGVSLWLNGNTFKTES